MRLRPPKGLCWQFNWKITVFSFVFFPLLVGLGIWQLDRAAQKQGLLDAWSDNKNTPPVPFLELALDERETHRPVHLTGTFLPEKFWLQEGKIIHGQVGLNIIMPFLLEDNSIVLVDRGWVKSPSDRNQMPVLQTPNYGISILGRIAANSDVALIDERDNPLIGWPHRMLKLDIDLMAEQFGDVLHKHVVRMDAADPVAFYIPPMMLQMPPEKHRAYAAQWFGLALILVFLWAGANTNMYSIVFRTNDSE